MLLLRLATKAEAKFSSVFAFLKLIKGCQHTLDREIMKETAGKQDGKPSHCMLLHHQRRPIKSNKGRSCYKISYQASQADKYNFLCGCHHFLFGFILLQCCFFLVRTPTHLLLEASEGENLSFLLLLVSPIRIPILFPCEHHHAQTT